jgi:hypothetical protein
LSVIELDDIGLFLTEVSGVIAGLERIVYFAHADTNHTLKELLKGGADHVIFPWNSGHEESDGISHFWRCSNGKEAQAFYERI